MMVMKFLYFFRNLFNPSSKITLQMFYDEQISVSLDENIIDFESIRIKERRAYDEVSTGKYRHPNFIASKLNHFLLCFSYYT